jgi:hypothetical protein
MITRWWRCVGWPDRVAGLSTPVAAVAFVWCTVTDRRGLLGYVVGGYVALAMLWCLLTLRMLRRESQGDDLDPPRDVRAVMADGREIPLECRYVGWDGTTHLWEAVHPLPEPPMSVGIRGVPPRTSIVVTVDMKGAVGDGS